eukprot:COSAG02_NODE_68142_length_251_cov_0.684211_1_plen_23_part_01
MNCKFTHGGLYAERARVLVMGVV